MIRFILIGLFGWALLPLTLFVGFCLLDYLLDKRRDRMREQRAVRLVNDFCGAECLWDDEVEAIMDAIDDRDDFDLFLELAEDREWVRDGTEWLELYANRGMADA